MKRLRLLNAFDATQFQDTINFADMPEDIKAEAAADTMYAIMLASASDGGSLEERPNGTEKMRSTANHLLSKMNSAEAKEIASLHRINAETRSMKVQEQVYIKTEA